MFGPKVLGIYYISGTVHLSGIVPVAAAAA